MIIFRFREMGGVYMQGLSEKIKSININLRTKENKKISKDDLRSILNRTVGNILKSNSIDSVKKYMDFGILGVDGSINTYGATFPYQLSFFRSCVMNTKADNKGERILKNEDIFSPVLVDHRNILDKIIEENNGKMTYEGALALYNKQKLAELELQIAIEGVKKFGSKVILLDGGFVRYELLCPALLETFKILCLETETLAVGVIEEVSTHKLSRLLEFELPESMSNDYDRELLFGALNVKEWLKINEDIEIKQGYHTSFAKLSKHPQVIGIDLFKEQMDKIETVVSLLDSLTPIGSRGVPVWIDIVDKEVRITKKEIDVLMSGIDIDIQEKFFIAQKDRRQY